MSVLFVMEFRTRTVLILGVTVYRDFKFNGCIAPTLKIRRRFLTG